jgi:hypothetical protein
MTFRITKKKPKYPTCNVHKDHLNFSRQTETACLVLGSNSISDFPLSTKSTVRYPCNPENSF